jgi:hypothetical protein
MTVTASNNQSSGLVTGSNATASKTFTLTTSGATATVSDGTTSVSKSVSTATRANTTLSIPSGTGTSFTATAGNNQSTGYVTGSNKTATTTVYLRENGATVEAASATSGGTGYGKKTITSGYLGAPTYLGINSAEPNSDLVLQLASTVESPGWVQSEGTDHGVTTDIPVVEATSPEIFATPGGSITIHSSQPTGYISENTSFIPKFTYTVNPIVRGAKYGFELNDSGYWESQNGKNPEDEPDGIHESIAACEVSFVVRETCDITFKVINFAESNYDYAIFSNLNTSMPVTWDEYNDVNPDLVYQSFKGQQSPDEVDLVYTGVAPGFHYIQVNFRKDSSADAGNDSVQFKVQPASGSYGGVGGYEAYESNLNYRLTGGAITPMPNASNAYGSGVTLGAGKTSTAGMTNYINVMTSSAVQQEALILSGPTGNKVICEPITYSGGNEIKYYPIQSITPKRVQVSIKNTTGTGTLYAIGLGSTSSNGACRVVDGTMPEFGVLSVTNGSTQSAYYPVGSTVIIFCHNGAVSGTASTTSTSVSNVGGSTRCWSVKVPSSSVTITML